MALFGHRLTRPYMGRGRSRQGAAILLAAVAVLLHSRTQFRRSATVPLEASVQATGTQVKPPPAVATRPEALGEAIVRRVLVASAVAAPLPANAILGLFEGPNLVSYTVGGAFNISLPPDYKVLEQDKAAFKWQGDRIQPLEKMSAGAFKTEKPSLAVILGSNLTEAGLRLAGKRPAGAALVLDGQADPNNKSIDIYQFEFQGDKLTEIQLYAVIKNGSSNVLCNVGLRTPPLLWEEKKELFRRIMSTFTPIEPQPPLVSTMDQKSAPADASGLASQTEQPGDTKAAEPVPAGA